MSGNLHFVFYSQMFKHGGGIETWADYFFKTINDNKINISKIYIYYISTDKLEDTILGDIKNNHLVHLVPIDIGDPIKNNSFFNYFNFTTKIRESLNEYLMHKDNIFIIGSLISGYILLSGIRRVTKRKSAKLITWVRSKAVGEISASKSSMYVLIGRILEYISFHYSYCIITNGYDTLKHFQGKYPKLKDRILVIPNAVNYQEFINSEIKGISKPINIAYTGRPSAAKGFYDFTNSIQVLSSNTDLLDYFKFNVYGDVTEDTFKKYPVINFYGAYNKKDIKKILQENDVIVFFNRKSQAGGLSHSLLEAMAAGCLIIAWDNDVHNQVLNSENSILVKENDIVGLLNAYLALKEANLDSYIPIRKQARDDAAMYSIESHMERFYNLVNNFKIEERM